MAAFHRKIVLSGYYGFQNSGDEAVLQSILLALQEAGREANVRFEPIVLSANPQQTVAAYGVKAVGRNEPQEILRTLRQSDGLISGGGSLLQDVTGVLTIPYYLGILKMAQWLNKPTFVYAQGIGPVRRKVFHAPIRHVFQRANYVSVRDPLSKQFLQQIAPGLSVDVVPDPVMAMPLPDSEHSVPRDPWNVAVSVRYWQTNQVVLSNLVKVLEQLLEDERVSVTFLPFHLPDDEKASLEIIEKMNSRFRPRIHMKSDVNPRVMLAYTDRSGLLIGMRLHALIYAANRAVPMIGISYDPKIDRFLDRLEMKASATTEQFDVSTVVAEARRFLQDASGWQAAKQAHIDRLKEESLIPARSVAAFYQQKG